MNWLLKKRWLMTKPEQRQMSDRERADRARDNENFLFEMMKNRILDGVPLGDVLFPAKVGAYPPRTMQLFDRWYRTEFDTTF